MVVDGLWERLEPLIPRRERPVPLHGWACSRRQAGSGRILSVARTGIPWQQLPMAAFGVSGSTCWRRVAAVAVRERLHPDRTAGQGDGPQLGRRGRSGRRSPSTARRWRPADRTGAAGHGRSGGGAQRLCPGCRRARRSRCSPAPGGRPSRPRCAASRPGRGGGHRPDDVAGTGRRADRHGEQHAEHGQRGSGAEPATPARRAGDPGTDGPPHAEACGGRNGAGLAVGGAPAVAPIRRVRSWGRRPCR